MALQVKDRPDNLPTISVAPVQKQPSIKVEPLPAQPKISVAAPTPQPKLSVQPLPQQPTIAVPARPPEPKNMAKVAGDINVARTRTTDDDLILNTLAQKNPDLAPNIEEARKRGANATQILNHIQQKYTPTETPADEGVSGLKGFGVGAAKGAASTLDTIAGIGGKILGQTAGRVANLVTGNGFTPIEASRLNKEFITPKGTAEKIGFGTEQVAEFLIPGSAVSKVGKATEAGIEGLKLANQFGKAGKVAETVLNYGAKAGIGAAEAAGVTALQGGDSDEVKNAAKFGAAFPFVAKAIGALGTAAKETSKFIASSLSGVPKDAIEYALKNPAQVKTAITKAVQEGGDVAAQRIAKEAEEALEYLKDARSKGYQANLAQLEKETMVTKNGQLYVKRVLSDAEAKATKGYKPGTPVLVPTNLSTKGVKDVTTRTLKDFGVQAKGDVLDFSESALKKSQTKDLEELVSRIYEWKKTTPTGLDTLRQIIDGYRLGGINLSSSEKRFNAIIGNIRTNLSEYVSIRVPQIGKLKSEYAAQSEVIDNIIQQLKIGRGDPNTALRKLINVFNPKSQVYRPVVQELGEKAGVDLMADIAGLTMSRWTPEGLGKYLTGLVTGGAGIGAFANPAALAAIPPTLAASSPRVVGEAATTFGKIDQSQAGSVIKNAAPQVLKGFGVELSR